MNTTANIGITILGWEFLRVEYELSLLIDKEENVFGIWAEHIADIYFLLKGNDRSR
ncbi:hypothetical protein Cyrtocomes_00194 [Candidatus Cyrtobacter comes]|uniref:Uncharacterized protein n=1 Tax=Candidatus Cyrtobacter comes TaxID=675776 RepID=A0ABU5L6T8_9RICK|nr:hypothetical protein [Candidatus Cyrtobacter comes]MDZ5761836.1 hypothetical protein [Candidatus Cyrtobacter comes]